MKQSTLTEGPIGKQILAFTLPLILGNVFQQLYNTADTLIVGRFVGDTALAAVGSSGALINLLISLFMGIGIGAGVVIARYFGAGDTESLSKTIHTTVAAAIAAGAALSLIGVLLTPTILRWMDTPDSVIDQSVTYFRIYFGGIIFTVLYNFGSAIFRALGDSRRPLYYLIFSSLVNIVLDILFVALFRWGVAGAAIATVMANALSIILVYHKLMTEPGPQRLELRKLRFHKTYLLQVVRIGLPSGLQNAVVSLSNVVIQSSINGFGDLAMAGTAAYRKIDGFALMPSGSFSMALSTFVSQNLGAGKTDRAKKGANFGLMASMISAAVIGILLFILARPAISLFSDEEEVIRCGMDMARTIAPFYCLVALSHGMAGILRGAGHAKVPMFVMMFCWCLFRVIWVETAGLFLHDIRVVYAAYPITWALSGIIFIIYYFKSDWQNPRRL